MMEQSLPSEFYRDSQPTATIAADEEGSPEVETIFE